MSRLSMFTRNPAASNSFIFRARLEKQYDVFMLLYADKNAYIVICFGEISGGRRNPFSSP